MATFCFLKLLFYYISLLLYNVNYTKRVYNCQCLYKMNTWVECLGSEIECSAPGDVAEPTENIPHFPNLSRIDIEPTADQFNSTYDALIIEWELQGTENLFEIELHINNGNLSCFYFNASNASIPTQVRLSIDLEDVETRTGGETFAIWSYPTASLTYEIKLPEDISSLTASTLDDWRSVLVVAANKFVRSLHIGYLQAPLNLGNVSYDLEVAHDGSHFHETDGQFYTFNLALADVTYTVRLNASNVSLSAYVPRTVAEHAIFLPQWHRLSNRPTGSASTEPVTIASTEPVTIETTEGSPTENDSGRRAIIAVGVTVGVIVLMALVGLVLYFMCRRRNKALQSNFPMTKLEGVPTAPRPPSVLLLYSADCSAHEQAVIELAYFMEREWHLDVILDLWEQKAIRDRGWLQWMNEKLMIVQYVLIICSTGARYKCARGRQFRLRYQRAVPDVFVNALDLVLERSYAAKQPNSGLNAPECLVAYFEYAGKSDIPPKLDLTKSCVLMNDMQSLYDHLTSKYSMKLKPSEKCLSPTEYRNTLVGKQLHEVLTKAVKFFAENPDWLALVLEPLYTPEPVPGRVTNTERVGEIVAEVSPAADESSRQESVSVGSNTNPRHADTPPSSINHSRMSSSATEEDALLEERYRRRKKQEEARMERVASSRNFDLLKQSPTVEPALVPPPKPPSLTSKLRNGGLLSFTPPQPRSLFGMSRSQRIQQSPSTCEDIDEEQMKKDLDFIRNYDLLHQWCKPAEANDFLLYMDFTACTPPEDVPLSESYINFVAQSHFKTHTKNGLNYFGNPLFFSLENGSADYIGPMLKSDENDNIILGFNPPCMQQSINHCDKSTDL